MSYLKKIPYQAEDRPQLNKSLSDW